MPIDSASLSYLAGILDGEGCIVIHLLKKLGYHLVRVMITNTDSGILRECARILSELGIFYNLKQQKKYNPKHKDVFVIECCRQAEMIFLLKTILPYMHSESKINRAKELLIHVETHDIRRDGKRSNRRKKQ